MGAKSPLLWDKGQVENLLAGSPVVNMVKDRLKVISAHGPNCVPSDACCHVGLDGTKAKVCGQ